MAGEWIPEKARGLVARFFPGNWEDMGGDTLQGRCPAEHLHSGGNAGTDARIYLKYRADGKAAPGVFCFHNQCRGVLDEMNQSFREELFRGDGGTSRGGGTFEEGVVIRPPRAREMWIPEFSTAKLRGVVRGMPDITEEWLMERSPVPIKSITGPGDFLEHAFEPGERVVIFTEFKGPGDYLWQVGKGGFRLSPDPGVKAVPSKLPVECGKDGAWFLSNPVSGAWYPNPRRDGRMSRRSQEAVTSWKHLILECDEEKTLRKKAHLLREASRQADPEKWFTEVKADPRWVAAMMPLRAGWLELAKQWDAEAPEVSSLWLRLLAISGLPIAAIYTSGGASVHALIREPKGSWPEFSELLREYKKRLPLVGADPAAMTPVRLTRLPGCKRGGKFQKLLYLDPKAEQRAIYGR
jgi:hypothetical protein